jgi:ribonucleotide reductase alpha subunit
MADIKALLSIQEYLSDSLTKYKARFKISNDMKTLGRIEEIRAIQMHIDSIISKEALK